MKPILITHPEVSARLVEWMMAHGWVKTNDPNFKKDFMFTKNIRQFDRLVYWNSGDDIAMPLGRVIYEERLDLYYELQIIDTYDTIEYEPEWIEKILSGEKTMSIRRTQYPCGHYWLVTPDGEKHGLIEIFNVRTYPMSIVLDTCERVLTTNENPSYLFIDALETAEKSGFGSYDNVGFDVIKKFIAYHRENYSAIKYKHDFNLIELEGDTE